jgi:hypothetical protein
MNLTVFRQLVSTYRGSDSDPDDSGQSVRIDNEVKEYKWSEPTLSAR